MKLLRKLINQLIKESVYNTDFSKIDWMITKLGMLENRVEVIIDNNHEDGNELVIEIRSIKEWGNRDIPEKIGILKIDKSWGNCLDAYQVSWSKVRKKWRHLGIGPLMYEVAIEYITQEFGVGLICDRESLSDKAFPVWEKFFERSKTDPEITVELLDFSHGSEDRKITPNNDQDDCDETTSMEWFMALKSNDYWEDGGPTPEFRKWWIEEDPTSKVYKKSPARTIKKLEEVGILRIYE
tara:strand:- start:83 stop:799 length:717 start_codon:yes stop_codon:yes gene_type:complete